MKLSLVSFLMFLSINIVGCKTHSTSSEKSWADVDATKPAVQLPNGQYLVYCQSGTQEAHPWADLVSGNICNTNTEARRCECVDSNGPDLMQIGFNADSGAVLWKTKIGGWNATAANWDICYAQLRSSPACQGDSHPNSYYTTCSCDENNGPDLNYYGRKVSGEVTPLFKTKIGGWGPNQYAACFSALTTDPLCANLALPPTLGKRCECVDNNGPDLMQIIYNRGTNAVIIKTKLNGWGSGGEGQKQCFDAIASSPACK